MRPRGEVRLAVAQAVQALAPEGGANTRVLAAQAQVGYAKAKEVVRDMARAGELAAAGTERVPGARRPMVRWVPAVKPAWARGGAAGVEAVLRAWHGGGMT